MAVDLVRFFDVLAHPVRLRIVGLLALEDRTVEELSHYHDEAATLRRALVDEELVQRASGVYWRAGTLPTAKESAG